MDSQATASVNIELLFMSLHKDASKLHLNHYLEFVYISTTVLTTKLDSLNNNTVQCALPMSFNFRLGTQLHS